MYVYAWPCFLFNVMLLLWCLEHFCDADELFAVCACLIMLRQKVANETHELRCWRQLCWYWLEILSLKYMILCTHDCFILLLMMFIYLKTLWCVELQHFKIDATTLLQNFTGRARPFQFTATVSYQFILLYQLSFLISPPSTNMITRISDWA